MAKLRQDRSRGQKLSKTPSAARTGYWPGVEAVPFPSSQPMPVKNTKIVFGDESQDQVALPNFGHSKISQSGAKPTSSHNMKANSSSQSKVLSSKNDVNARLASNGELSVTSANRDAHGVKSPENSANDLSSPTMAKSTSQNSSRLINGSKQDQAPGSKVRDHNGNQQKKQPSQQSIEAEGSTPISPEVKSSSLQKLKDAKAAALEHKKQSNQPVSHVTNVFNAHSPPRTSSTTFATPSATLPSSPSTALRQAAQKLGSWRASPEIMMYSSPLQPSAQSTKKKNKKRHSEPGHTTIIEAPKTYGPPPNPPSRKLSITKKEVRISNVWGKQFEGQKLIIEPFQTFSSKTSSFDVDSSSEDEYPDKAKKGQSHTGKIREKAKVKKEASAKKQKAGEQGWDVVLAEARNQAQRLERHRVEKDKLRNAAIDSAKGKDGETGKAEKKKGKKEDKDEQAARVPKKRKNSEVDATNEQAENEGKRRKTEESSVNEKRHKKNKEKKQQHSSNEVGKTDMSDPKTDERQNELTSKNNSIYAKPCTETPTLIDLRQLIPTAVLNSAANALNDAEHCQIKELLARKKRKEFKKIERGMISLNDAIWQDLSVEGAQKNNLVEEVKIFSAHDDAVVVRAAVNLIRALSQNAVLSACNNVPAGEAGKLGAIGH